MAEVDTNNLERIKQDVPCWLYWIKAPHHNDILSEGYVGITTLKNPISRFSQHKKAARIMKNNLPIHNALRKYGDSIEFKVILKGTLEYCRFIERKLRPSTNIGYNVGVGGASPRLFSKASDETRLKLSVSRKGRKFSDSTRKAISESQKGKIIPEDTKLKMSATHKKRLSIPWVNNTAISEIWENAIYYREIILLNKDLTYFILAKQLGIPPSSFKTIHKYIVAGWNPEEDENWLSHFKRN